MTIAPVASSARQLAVDSRSAVALARRAWSLTTSAGPVRVRGAVPADLRGVAVMHGRCSAETLLQRYSRGGRAPSLTVLSQLVHQPLTIVAVAEDGAVVALATGTRPATREGTPDPPSRTMQLALVVEDAWQQRGIGRALAGHVAACAQLLGYRDLVADVAAQGLPLRRIMDGLGVTRASRHPGGCRLQTRLDLSVLGSLGSVQGVLAG